MTEYTLFPNKPLNHNPSLIKRVCFDCGVKLSLMPSMRFPKSIVKSRRRKLFDEVHDKGSSVRGHKLSQSNAITFHLRRQQTLMTCEAFLLSHRFSLDSDKFNFSFTLLFLFYIATLRHVTFNSPLFPSDELRVDALRGILSPHGPRLCLHLRAKARQMADSFRVERSGTLSHPLRDVKRFL